MKKIITISKVIIIITGIIVALLRTFTDVPIIRMVELLLSSYMFLSAYEHKQLKKESNKRFWFYIFAGILCLIRAFFAIRPYF